jgi:hypothetical protein
MSRTKAWIVLAFSVGVAAMSFADDTPKSVIPGVDFMKPGPSPSPTPSAAPARSAKKRNHRDPSTLGLGAAGNNQGYTSGVGKVRIGF